MKFTPLHFLPSVRHSLRRNQIYMLMKWQRSFKKRCAIRQSIQTRKTTTFPLIFRRWFHNQHHQSITNLALPTWAEQFGANRAKPKTRDTAISEWGEMTCGSAKFLRRAPPATKMRVFLCVVMKVPLTKYENSNRYRRRTDHGRRASRAGVDLFPYLSHFAVANFIDHNCQSNETSAGISKLLFSAQLLFSVFLHYHYYFWTVS